MHAQHDGGRGLAHLAGGFRGLQEVVRAHAGGKQRLVGVAHRGVCDEQPVVRPHGLSPSLRALLLEHVAPPGEADTVKLREDGHNRHIGRRRGADRTRVIRAVDDHLGEVVHELLAHDAVVAHRKELGGVALDERGRRVAARKLRVGQDVDDKADVGLDATHEELVERSLELPQGLLVRRRVRDHLHGRRCNSVTPRLKNNTGAWCPPPEQACDGMRPLSCQKSKLDTLHPLRALRHHGKSPYVPTGLVVVLQPPAAWSASAPSATHGRRPATGVRSTRPPEANARFRGQALKGGTFQG